MSPFLGVEIISPLPADTPCFSCGEEQEFLLGNLRGRPRAVFFSYEVPEIEYGERNHIVVAYPQQSRMSFSSRDGTLTRSTPWMQLTTCWS